MGALKLRSFFFAHTVVSVRNHKKKRNAVVMFAIQAVLFSSNLLESILEMH